MKNDAGGQKKQLASPNKEFLQQLAGLYGRIGVEELPRKIMIIIRQ